MRWLVPASSTHGCLADIGLLWLVVAIFVTAGCAPSAVGLTSTTVYSIGQAKTHAPTPTATASETATWTPTASPSPNQTPSPTPTARLTPSASPTVRPGWRAFEAEGLWISYPGNWFRQIPGTDPLQGETKTILFLVRSTDGVNLGITLTPLSAFGPKTAEDIEQASWEFLLFLYQSLGLQDKVTELRRETFAVSGFPAASRDFLGPGIQDTQHTYYKRIIYVVPGDRVYQFVFTSTTEAGVLDPELDQMIESFQISP